MTAYCDSSFFIRQLIPGPDRAESIDIAHKLIERLGAIPVSNFTRFEVIQALRFEAWRNKNDRARGLPAQQVEAALNLFLGEIAGSFALTSPDFEKVLVQAESLSRSTSERGWRTVDL